MAIEEPRRLMRSRPAMVLTSRGARFLFGLLLGLAAVTWLGSLAVERTTRGWFERDITLRAHLAANGARQHLLAHWGVDDRATLHRVLGELTRDERIMAAAACGPDLSLLAATPEFPAQLSCGRAGSRARAAGGDPALDREAWKDVLALPGGKVQVDAVPMSSDGVARGFLVLVHDLSFIERREATTQRFLLGAFGVMALAAAGVTIMAARLSWRHWSEEVRRFLKGGPNRPEFQPILRDVRELVDRIIEEKEIDQESGAWTANRLKLTLSRHLHGEKVVIVANREPYIHQRNADGTISVLHPASGLVTALEPVMRACSGVWVAHGAGSADRETADSAGRLLVPPGGDAYRLRRVWLSTAEEKGYYYGFSNEGLWPLCHLADTRPTFRSQDWRRYEEVNRKFVDAVCSEVDAEDPIVLVQDYHFALAPQLLRARLPRATIITFWHIPWPNSERFGICPWRTEILEGLLGSSILGFHTQLHCNNFMDSVDRFLEARIDRDRNAVVQQGRTTLVRPYPISLEWPVRWVQGLPPAAECRAAVAAELGLAPDAVLGVGVDRLDYTKGIEERLLAVERLLERFPSLRGRFTFAQLAAPSRTEIERYRHLSVRLEEVAARINDRFGAAGYRPVRLLRGHHEPPTVFRYYRAADVCYISSLHDGMNLVAKEFVAARDDDRGVLVLSEFTGAARDLTEALIVNPYDLEAASSALARAIGMSSEEQRERMRSMRAFLAEFNVYRWAGRMLVDAARIRRRERLTGRLTDHLTTATA
jgi:trehalose 6-phosphate synthase